MKMMKRNKNACRFNKYPLAIFCSAFMWFMLNDVSNAQITGFTLKEGKADRTYYVSPGGNGDGSAANPFGNIDQALKAALSSRAEADKTVRVILRDGVYRQTVAVTEAHKYTGKSLLILEAEHPGKATISGARELKDWRKFSSKGNPVFWTDLPDDYITALTRNGDRIFPNGKTPNPWPKNVKTLGGMLNNGVLRMGNNYYFPVTTLDSVIIGSFFIDYGAKKIYARITSTDGIDRSELAIAPAVFNLSNNNNIIIRGINIEMAGWAFGTAARLNNIDNLLVADCKFNNNRYGGLGLHQVKNATFRNVEMCHNGGKGGGGSWGTTGYLRNVICDKIKVNYNNWINYQYGWLGWDPCGIKFAAVRQMLIKDSEFNGNYASGLWMDTEFRGVFVENTTMAGNFGNGTFVEASMGPITFTKCNMYDNDHGVYISATDSVTIDGCKIYNNIVQIGVYDHNGMGRGYKSEGQYDFADIDNHGEWRSHSIYAVIKNNQISNQSYNTTPLINQRGNDTIGYRNFMNTLTIENNNLIFGSSGTTPFYYKQGQKPYKADVWRKD